MSIGGAGAIPLRPAANSSSPTPSTRTPAVGVEQDAPDARARRGSACATRARARACARARAAARGGRARPARARPQRRTSPPRSHPRADAARPGRWRNALPLRGRIVKAPAGRDARPARRAPASALRRDGAHCMCHARPSAIATAWIASWRASSAGFGLLERARDRVDQGAVAVRVERREPLAVDRARAERHRHLQLRVAALVERQQLLQQLADEVQRARRRRSPAPAARPGRSRARRRRTAGRPWS